MTVTWSKIEIFKIQDGCGRHLENRFLDHNSSTDFSDFSEILYEEQNDMLTEATWQKLQFFLKSKMADGRHLENR